ncbi:MAG: hypothetical protein HOV80_36185 [Polyangiaceae bacterium]|nr:hypothetical protein [Polyangiaceae bacterium]
MSKKRNTSKTSSQASPATAEDTYEKALRYLSEQIQLVIDGKAAKTKHDPAYRVATLTRMVAQVDAERRKARAAETKKLEKVTRPLVIAWLRSTDSEERRSVAREIAAMEQEGSVLA